MPNLMDESTALRRQVRDIIRAAVSVTGTNGSPRIGTSPVGQMMVAWAGGGENEYLCNIAVTSRNFRAARILKSALVDLGRFGISTVRGPSRRRTTVRGTHWAW
jgi:hypothetical protein